MMTKPTVVITGTHFTPALALIEALKASGYKVVYIGRTQSVEARLLPAKRIPLVSLTAPKFKRHQWWRLPFDLLRLPRIVLVAYRQLRTLKPCVVVSFGGFIALPVCLGAKLLPLPLIIHEQTLRAGLTSRLTAILADKVALSWPQSRRFFPRKKTVLTGNPLRRALLEPHFKSVFPSSRPKTIYLTAGNQGSKTINQVIRPILPQLLSRYRVVHQFGLRQSYADWRKQLRFKAKLPKHCQSRYRLARWFSTKTLAKILSQTDLVVGRSGINTVSELIYFNKPAVLIPLPFTQKHEQLQNARLLQSQGLALILPQDQLTSQSLFEQINQGLRLFSRPAKPTVDIERSLFTQATSRLIQLIKVYCEPN